MRTFILSMVALSLATSLGCSFSDSSGSISDSISSPSESISKSSGSDSSDGDDTPEPAPETTEEKVSYGNDVSQMTVTYLKSGGDLGAYRAAISKLAKERGMTDWEADPVTTQAIGRGAGEAGLDESAFQDFSKRLVGDDLARLNELRKGYQASPPALPAEPSAETNPS
jgi:hypothetical protein